MFLFLPIRFGVVDLSCRSAFFCAFLSSEKSELTRIIVPSLSNISKFGVVDLTRGTSSVSYSCDEKLACESSKSFDF
jgi:hypothetical protein